MFYFFSFSLIILFFLHAPDCISGYLAWVPRSLEGSRPEIPHTSIASEKMTLKGSNTLYITEDKKKNYK